MDEDDIYLLLYPDSVYMRSLQIKYSTILSRSYMTFLLILHIIAFARLKDHLNVGWRDVAN